MVRWEVAYLWGFEFHAASFDILNIGFVLILLEAYS